MNLAHSVRKSQPLRDLKRIGVALLLGATLASARHAAADCLDDIPRLPNGRPDFSGIWQTTSAADYDLEPHAHRHDAPPGRA